MGETVEVFLGFDPGGKKGKGKFGWSICRDEAGEFEQLDSDVAKNAGEVVSQVLDKLLPNERIVAVGIDAPLFWDKTGKDRKADKIIRGEVKNKSVKSSVIAVNSLQGACLVQGILVGDAFYRLNAPITETHPRVLRYLLKQSLSRKAYPAELCKRKKETSHQWDARTAAYAAWAMWKDLQGQRLDGWQDLFLTETAPFLPLGRKVRVSYWMPIPRNNRTR